MFKVNLEKALDRIEEYNYFAQTDRFKIKFNPEIKNETRLKLRKTWLALEEVRRGLE